MNTKPQTREEGFSLVVALLLLVALTIVGVASMRNVTLQQKMTNNMYFRSVAFNESYATLRLAQQESFDAFGGVSGVLDSCSSSNPRNLCLTNGLSSFAAMAEDAAWLNAQTAPAELNNGFPSVWVNENVHRGVGVKAIGCQDSTGVVAGASFASCGRTFVRQTARSSDTVTGAFSVTQQHFRFLGEAIDR
jgi:Tfp pilus assembly protein PilX